MSPPHPDRPLSWVRRAIAAGALASAIAALAWALVTIGARPLDGVEGDVLFEADRLRAGYPLFVDPRVGAHEYGAVAARYHVLYPPLWAAALSLAPMGAAHLVARGVALSAWVLSLAWIVRRAPEERRGPVALAVAFALGSFHLTMYAAAGRPDGLAAALAVTALTRAAGRGRADAIDGAVLALAAFVKPNVVGIGAGLALAAVASGARGGAPFLGGLALGGLALGATLQIASSGAWLSHLFASTAQRPSLSLWSSQVLDRAPFFGAPLALALWLGARSRAVPGVRLAWAALASSTAWALFSFAKTGSAANYLLEPAGAAIVLLAHVPRERLPSLGRGAMAAAVLQIAWTGVATARSVAERVPMAFAQRAALARVRDACAGALTLADEPGLERTLNGRIVATPFQTTHLVRRGAFPVSRWLEDVRAPEIRCLVMQSDLLERAPEVDSPAHDRFGPELRAALRERFALAWTDAGLWFYAARR